MFETAINILKNIEAKGFEAYIIGGYPRDLYLNRYNNDIDICTNAKYSDLKNMYPNIQNKNYGSYILKINNYYFEITTYRKEINYINNRFPSVEFVNKLEDDLIRRDFTINTLCINSDKKYIDLLGAKKDLDNKILKVVGDSEIKIKEDSLRILRAIRFTIMYNLEIDDELDLALKNHSYLVSNLSYDRKKEELNKIFKYREKCLDLLLKYNLDKYLELNNLRNINFNTDVIGIWAQLDILNIYPFTKQEKERIKNINNIINDSSIYNLYKNNLEDIQIAAQILNNYDLIKIYKNLPIKKRNDIDITNLEIINLLNNNKINAIINDLEVKILTGNLKNSKYEIICYLKNNYIL